jgi:hypothetical protein
MWMLSPSSAEIGIRERAVLSKEALLSLSCILESRHNGVTITFSQSQ